ncbi:Long chain acyl-CoA synthetase 2 [Camellia lanceoleosa]|uniref:Long chain acyl-CoA synthetase 2 n=1 Tax=Camellia lanceoleosa TaxID=1840588 RepID=A0ACC0H9R3_9ERIC|nr:Long chain acyl-CoA synthetase 2 [Camellia lanceoleosa]
MMPLFKFVPDGQSWRTVQYIWIQFPRMDHFDGGYVTKVNLNFNHHRPLVCSAGVTDANSVEFIINHPEVSIPFVQENKIDTGYANMPSKVYFTSKNYCQLWEISSMQKKEAEDLGVSCFSWKEFALLGSLDRKFPQSDICMMMMYASGTTGERKGVVLTNGMIMAEACLQINCYLKQRKW